MKTEAKTIRVIPYGRLVDRTHAFAPADIEHLRVSKTWRRLQRPGAHELWHLLIAFSDELDKSFVRTFRERATVNTRLLVLNDSRSSDSLLSRIVDLQIRSAHRFYVADRPVARTNEQHWEDLLRSFLGRLTAALESKESDGRIFDARLEDRTLHIVSSDFRRLEIPVSKIPMLADADQQDIEHFEIDEDGSFIYWPDLDLHLGWEQVQQVDDPAAVQKAKQKSREFNVRYGAAIRTVRNEKGLSTGGIPGLSKKQLARIENGVCRLTSNAAEKLAEAHRLKPNEYLELVAAALQ